MTISDDKRIRRALIDRSAGYTLLELMVVTAVIAILSTMAVVYSKTTDRRARLTRQAEQMVFDIRRAQTLSLGTRLRVGGTTPCGYGLRFSDNATQYILYEERSLVPPPPLRCPTGNPPSPRPRYNAGTDVVIETIDLSSGLELQVVSGASADVTFLSPEPRTTFEPPGLEPDLRIRVQLQSSGVFREVRVTTAGLIEVVP